MSKELDWETKSDYGSLVREMFKNTDAPTRQLREAYVEGVAKMLHYGVPRVAVFSAFFLLHNLYISREKDLLTAKEDALRKAFKEKFTDNQGIFVDLEAGQPPAPIRLTKRAYREILALLTPKN